MSIKIKKIDFNNKNDNRILESALNNWFKDPKELNFLIDGTIKTIKGISKKII